MLTMRFGPGVFSIQAVLCVSGTVSPILKFQSNASIYFFSDFLKEDKTNESPQKG
jgi:hypothetical protein